MSLSAQREPRLPLLVQVETNPPLLDCWSINLSRSGLGLIAVSTPDYPPLPEGAGITASFRLPDFKTSVRVHGNIAWRHENKQLRDRGSVSLGVAISSISEPSSQALAQYLEQYRFRVALVGNDDARRASIGAMLGELFELHTARGVSDLQNLLARGDISVVVLAEQDPIVACNIMDWLAKLPERSAIHGPGFIDDLHPRLICCSPVPEGVLLQAFNEGKIFYSLSGPFAASTLAEVVLAGCRDYGERTEHHRVGLALERALRRERSQVHPRSRPLALDNARLISASQAMQQVVRMAETVAPFPTSVLLTGETGVGKEVVARLIHDLSGRARADFIVQDCGTLTETLLESELFGHTKGAFTGATCDREGLFVAADGGSVLLDEVENMSATLQAKLLRVIDTGEVRPVGSTTTKAVSVRIIAATNKDLTAEVEAGRFRRDLYYRLSMFPIPIPPLRERRADILPLARRFLCEACTAFDTPLLTLSSAAAELLQLYAWPGNARELRNIIERAVLMSAKDAIHLEASVLPVTMLTARARHTATTQNSDCSLKALVTAFEAEIINEALKTHGGSVRKTAAALAADEATLWRKVKRYRLK